MDIMTGYRAGIFDDEANIGWLRHGWRALRLYGRQARAAIEAEDLVTKAKMIAKADDLLNVMTGIVDTAEGTTLGPALLTIYTALRHTLLRANLDNDISALADYEAALGLLDRDMIKSSEHARDT